MPDRDFSFIHVAALVLAIQISLAVWWIPQKWAVCQRLYDNLPARIVCLSAHA